VLRCFVRRAPSRLSRRGGAGALVRISASISILPSNSQGGHRSGRSPGEGRFGFVFLSSAAALSLSVVVATLSCLCLCLCRLSWLCPCLCRLSWLCLCPCSCPCPYLCPCLYPYLYLRRCLLGVTFSLISRPSLPMLRRWPFPDRLFLVDLGGYLLIGFSNVAALATSMMPAVRVTV